MKLFFHSENNVGDQLNSWLWEDLLGVPVDELMPRDALFIGIGTILRNTIPANPRTKYVMGAGCGYDPPPTLTEDWNLIMVRGPLTAKLLGISEDVAVSDPGILVRRYYQKNPNAAKVGFMPHYSSAILCDWESICADADITFLNPMFKIDDLMKDFSECRLIITEAMHGAIMADALRVPWVAVKTRGSILKFKWMDWAQSLDISFKFQYLPPPYRAGLKGRLGALLRPLVVSRLRSIRNQPGILSRVDILDSASREIERRLREFKSKCSFPISLTYYSYVMHSIHRLVVLKPPQKS